MVIVFKGKDVSFSLINNFKGQNTFSKLLQLYIKKFFRQVSNKDKNNPNNRKHKKGKKKKHTRKTTESCLLWYERGTCPI